MHIHSVRVKNYKNIQDAKIEFKGNISGIYGPNGSGKTSIIEVLDIVKKYILGKNVEKFNQEFKEMILNGITMDMDIVSIEVVFGYKEKVYRLFLEFQLMGSDIVLLKEEYSYREDVPRSRFKYIFRVDNTKDSAIPLFFIGNTNKPADKLLDKIGMSEKAFLLEFSKIYSPMMIILSKSKMEEFKEFSTLFNLALHYTVIDLKEQSLINLGRFIPLSFYIKEDLSGKIPLVHIEGKNIYTIEEVKLLKEIVEQIKDIFNIVVPGAQLVCVEKLVEINLEGKQHYSINIFVRRNDKLIPLERESTGVIKIFCLLSSLVSYVVDEDSIVIVDELDIYLFEHLLATILEKLSEHAKGQLIFTAHNLLPLERLSKDSIIITTTDDDDNVIYTYLKGVSKTTNLRQKYLRSQMLWCEDNIKPCMINESELSVYICGLDKK